MTPEHRFTYCSALRLPFATLIALSAAACQPDDDDGRVATVIGDRAVVTFARPLCPSDITLIEQTIEHVEGELDTQLESPIEIALWSRYDDVVARCSEGPTGCYVNGEVHALWQALEHEIVHAVAVPLLGAPEPLWLEGIAEALSGRTNEGAEDVGSLVGLQDSREVDYTTAGHFVRWLREEHGIEGIRALARESSFEDAYGMPLAGVIEDFEQDAPWSYPDWNSCRGGLLSATEPEVWTHDIAVDCEGAWGSARYGAGPSVLRTIDIEAAGTYRLSVSGARSVSIVACQLDVLLDAPVDDMAGDVIRESAGLRLPTMFVGDEVHEIALEPGRLQVTIVVEGGDAAVGFELRRVGA